MKFDSSAILVVDDNEDNRRILAQRLGRRGYTVTLASDGREALQLVETHKFDMILLDIMMPVLDGFGVLETVRRKHSLAELPIIMTTAKDESGDIVKALKLGANDYVTKPIDFAVLQARIQTHLTVKRLSQLKDEFLRIASHDLKNPIWSILTASQMVEDLVPPDDPLADPVYKMFGVITKNARQMQHIIEDFLDFEAAQDGQIKLELTLTDLNEVARQAVELNTDYARVKNLDLVFDPAPALPCVQADKARLLQVAQNFVGNAIKFSRKNAGEIRVCTHLDQQSVRFEVSDPGPGLREEDMEKVFVKYARLSARPTGGEKSSGLGLAIAKQMIDLHQGQIGVHNNPDQGATFWFSLPLTPGD